MTMKIYNTVDYKMGSVPNWRKQSYKPEPQMDI